MKKITSLVLALLMICTMMSVFAVPASAKELRDTIDDFVDSPRALQDRIDELAPGGTLKARVKCDFRFIEPVVIDKPCTINFDVGNYDNFWIENCRAFYVDADNVTLNFDRLTINQRFGPYSRDGEAIYVDGENCTISNAYFYGCQSDEGGAIFVNDEGCRIENCKFVDCQASDDGGAIFADDDCDIVNCTFFRCTAGNDGGAICVCELGCDVSVFTSKFTYCSSKDQGDIVYGDGETNIFACDPETDDDSKFYRCNIITKAEYEAQKTFLKSILERLGLASTFSGGSLWIVAGIGVVAVAAVAVIVMKKKKAK